jgi:hypothetical protein
MSIYNLGSYYTNLIEPRVAQTVFVQPNPALTSVLGTSANQYVPMAGVFGAGSVITNVQLAGANPNNATFMVGVSGLDAGLTGNLIILGTANGVQIPGTAAGLGVTLAQDSWLTVVSSGTAAGTLAANQLNLCVTYLS